MEPRIEPSGRGSRLSFAGSLKEVAKEMLCVQGDHEQSSESSEDTVSRMSLRQYARWGSQVTENRNCKLATGFGSQRPLSSRRPD